MLRRITYCATNCLSCDSIGSEVVLNIPKAIAAQESCTDTAFISATITAVSHVRGSCGDRGTHGYVYEFEYDDTQIATGQTLLAEHILGIICRDVLTRYIENVLCGGVMSTCPCTFPEDLCMIFAQKGICGLFDCVSQTVQGEIQTFYICQRDTNGNLSPLFDSFPEGLNELFFIPHITVTGPAPASTAIFDYDLPPGSDSFTIIFPSDGVYTITGTWTLKIGSVEYDYVIPCIGETHNITVTVEGIDNPN